MHIPLQLSNYSKTRGLLGSPFLAPLLYKYSEKSSEVRELHLCPEKTRNLAKFVIGRSLFASWGFSRNKENCKRRSCPKDLWHFSMHIIKYRFLTTETIWKALYTGSSRLMRISLLRISLLRFFKTITKIWLMLFYRLFILLLRT